VTNDVIEHYRQLLADQGIGDAVCVTYAQGIDEDAMIRAFGGDPDQAALRSLAEVGEELAGYHYSEAPHVLPVTRVSDWLIGVEPNGFQGSRPEVLRAASVDGSALSVYWNINASNRFTYAADGRTSVVFDMRRPEDRQGRDPGALDAHLGGLPFGSGGNAWAAGLALAERVTGVRLTAALLEGTFRRALLRAVPEDLVYEGLVGDPALNVPFIREVLAEPTVEKLPAIARYLAEAVARDTGVDSVPEVRAALDALSTGTPPDPGLRQRVLDLATRYEEALRAGRETLQRIHAVRGIAAALDPDPEKACFEVNSWAVNSLHSRDYRVQHSVLRRCLRRAVANSRNVLERVTPKRTHGAPTGRRAPADCLGSSVPKASQTSSTYSSSSTSATAAWLTTTTRPGHRPRHSSRRKTPRLTRWPPQRGGCRDDRDTGRCDGEEEEAGAVCGEAGRGRVRSAGPGAGAVVDRPGRAAQAADEGGSWRRRCRRR